MDPIHQLQQFNQGRHATGLALKYRKMRDSAFVFLRGSCHLFYDRLAQGPALPDAPLVWVCGDLHLENYGSYKADDRQLHFDINDFDEAVLAPASWDLVRMLCSIALGADSACLAPQESAQLGLAFLEAYAESLSQGKVGSVQQTNATGLVSRLLETAEARKRSTLLDKYTDLQGKQRVLRLDGKRAFAANTTQKQMVRDCLSVIAQRHGKPGFYEVLDVAQRLAGTGSLGLERYVILVQGKGAPDGHYLLDLKCAGPSALLAHLSAVQPGWDSQAHRIVGVQRRMQAESMAFLQPVLAGKTAYVLRELQASEDRVELQTTHQQANERLALLRTMGQVLAWAQLRSAAHAGSANVDALQAFGKAAHWKAALLACAATLTAQTRADWSSFCTAYDKGALHA